MLPKLSQLGFSAATVKPADGLTVDYTDTTTSVTTLKLFQEVFGRKVGGKCVTAPTPAEHSDPVCRFFKQVGVTHHQDTAGGNSVHVDTTGLTNGTYQIKLSAKANDKLSTLLVKTFRVAGGAPAAKPTPAAPQTPRLSGLAFNSGTIAPKAGLTVDYTDAASASTTLKIFHEVFGRKAGGTCDTTPSKAEHSDPVCRFFKQVSVLHHQDVAGHNIVHVTTAGYAGRHLSDQAECQGRRQALAAAGQDASASRG